MSLPVTDSPPRVVMRMNRHTVALGGALVAMWYAAASQSNGAIYLLAFTAASVGLISWLHARWNLRRIDWTSGPIQIDAQRGTLRLPFRIQNKAATAACSLEIAAQGMKTPVFIPELGAGQHHLDDLRIPLAKVGTRQPISILVRSLYPLGFFTAELRLAVIPQQRIPPRGEGTLPLPEPIADGRGAASSRASYQGPSQPGGDDFSGVRAWQAGDSPRHIDWKAAARERPLMTKQWSRDSLPELQLDWSKLDLPDAARVRQMIQWIDQCESESRTWSLRLPGRTLGPSTGAHHAQECRQALAALMPEEITATAQSRRTSLPMIHETTARVPRGTVILLCLALLLCLPPMFGEVSLIGMGILTLAAVLRVTLDRWTLPLMARLALMLVGGGLVFYTQPERRSMEATTALLLVFIGGKILESRVPRDFQVLALLGWFLCMCALSMEQSLGWTLYVAITFVLITLAWTRLRRAQAPARSSARTTFSLIAQALPLTVLMFLLFPRGTEQFVASLARRAGNRSGLSNVMEPGSVARVALSNDTAFHAEFPEGSPPPQERYWRCLVLWQCDGLRWSRGRSYSEKVMEGQTAGRSIQQNIILKPHGDLWLPALERVTRIRGLRSGAGVEPDGSVTAYRPVDSVLRYTADSQSPPPVTFLADAVRTQATQTPLTLSGEVENLALRFRPTPETTDEQVVSAALDYLRNSGFRYTLEPGTYAPDVGLEDFLLRRKVGFCEHFSAGFATLLRLADVPTRVIIGFLGGEFRESRNHWVVRNSDAHAWVEVWLKGKGWTRVDPTAALAPGRIANNLEAYLASGEDGAFAQQRDTWWWQAWASTRDAWDQLNFEWYDRVVTADDDTQSDLLDRMGLGTWHWPQLLAALVTGCSLLLSGIVLWLKRSARHPDEATRIWLRFCSKLARAGLPRQPHEGALAYSERASHAFPDLAGRLNEMGHLYNQLRYTPDRSQLAQFRSALADLPRIATLKKG